MGISPRGPEQSYIGAIDRNELRENNRERAEKLGHEVERGLTEILSSEMPFLDGEKTKHASKFDDEKKGVDILTVFKGKTKTLPLAIDCSIGAEDIVHKKIEQLVRYPFLDGVHDDTGELVENATMPKVLMGGNGSREMFRKMADDRLKGVQKPYTDYFSQEQLAKLREWTYNEIKLSLELSLHKGTNLPYEMKKMLKDYLAVVNEVHPQINK